MNAQKINRYFIDRETNCYVIRDGKTGRCVAETPTGVLLSQGENGIAREARFDAFNAFCALLNRVGEASLEIINACADSVDGADTELATICNGLEDGAALASLGYTDDDQEAIECAHALVVDAIKAGKVTANQL